MKEKLKSKCDLCKKIGNVIKGKLLASVFYRQKYTNWIWICKECWNK